MIEKIPDVSSQLVDEIGSINYAGRMQTTFIRNQAITLLNSLNGSNYISSSSDETEPANESDSDSASFNDQPPTYSDSEHSYWRSKRRQRSATIPSAPVIG